MNGSHKRQFAFTSAALLLLTAGSAYGQQTQSSYNWGHIFTWNPPPGAVGTPIVQIGGFEHAWLKESRGWTDWGATPLPQNAGFDPYGTDRPALNGSDNINSATGGAVPAAYSSMAITPAGFHYAGCGVMLVSPNTGSSASACLHFDVNPYGPGTSVTGELRASGGIIANAGVEGYAFSSPFATVTGTDATGHVLWTPDLFIEWGWTSAATPAPSDPVLITAIDVNGTSQTATALDIDFRADGLRQARWQRGAVELDARNLTLNVFMDPRVVRNPGRIRLRIQNDAVTQSIGTGIFTGLLPPVGAATPLAFTVPADIPIDYDASSLAPAGLVGVEVHMGGAADAAAGTDCPADFDRDGFVTGLDFDFYVAAFEEGGDNADFDGDGFVTGIDFDSYVVAFEDGCLSD